MEKTIGEMTKETLTLANYLEGKPAGAELRYREIEDETRVTMDLLGKQKLRSALRHIKREFATAKGVGIRLAAPSTALSIMAERISRIGSSVKRAHKTQELLSGQFLGQMELEDRNRLLYAGAVLGALRVSADSGRRIFKGGDHKQLPPADISIPVPKIE